MGHGKHDSMTRPTADAVGKRSLVVRSDLKLTISG